MPIQVEVWGDYACFTRPEMKTERVSYDVMTPSAARGLLDSLYWHPGLRWVIDRIHVCAPIRFTNIRRNEVKDVISARRAKTVMEKGQGELYLAASESIQQRAAKITSVCHFSSSSNGSSSWSTVRRSTSICGQTRRKRYRISGIQRMAMLA